MFVQTQRKWEKIRVCVRGSESGRKEDGALLRGSSGTVHHARVVGTWTVDGLDSFLFKKKKYLKGETQ